MWHENIRTIKRYFSRTVTYYGIPLGGVVALEGVGCTAKVKYSKGPFFEGSISSLQRLKGGIRLGERDATEIWEYKPALI